MSRLPNRWLLYTPIGEPIAGTRLISFKVPLKEALCTRLQERERFTPEMLMKQCPNLGLVIDLTFTTRYYDWKVFASNGIQYRKIPCPGQVIPADKLLKEFFNIVDAFLDETNGRDLLVGVHCTHGLNRTGYFTCRYMNLRMGIEPQKAIYAFEKARGHRMERLPYIQRILSGDSLEDEKIVQDGRTESGGRQSVSGPEHADTDFNPRLKHLRKQYPASSQPPPIPHIHPDCLVTEFPLISLRTGYISNTDFVRSEVSKNDASGNRNAGYQGHNHHHNYPLSKKRRKNKKYKPSGKQQLFEHPDQSESQSGTTADSSVNAFSVSTGTSIPNAFLNPRIEHSRQHRPAFSQPPPFVEKHPDNIRLDSPFTNLYNISSSSYMLPWRPKNGGTVNRNAGYEYHSPDHRYTPYNTHPRRKHQTLGQQSVVEHPAQNKSQSGTSKEVGLIGSSSANSIISEFSVPAGTANSNAVLNPRHTREHLPASFQLAFRQQKYPSSIHLESPLTNLYECLSSSSSMRRGPRKNDGSDRSYSPYDRHRQIKSGSRRQGASSQAS